MALPLFRTERLVQALSLLVLLVVGKDREREFAPLCVGSSVHRTHHLLVPAHQVRSSSDRLVLPEFPARPPIAIRLLWPFKSPSSIIWVLVSAVSLCVWQHLVFTSHIRLHQGHLSRWAVAPLPAVLLSARPLSPRPIALFTRIQLPLGYAAMSSACPWPLFSRARTVRPDPSIRLLLNERPDHMPAAKTSANAI